MNDFQKSLIKNEKSSIDLNISVSQWAEKYRYIKPPGWKTFELFDFKKTPYLRYPCDLFSKNSSCRNVTIVKGSRNGFSQGFILNSIMYNIAVNPVKMMYVSADQSLLDKFTKLELRPQLQASGLDRYIRAASNNAGNKNKSSGETGQLWEFGTDGYLALYGANNPNNFRQLGSQFVYKDERATYPIFKGEGDVSDLVDGRTDDYGLYAKIASVSTPTMAGSGFHKEYLSGTCEEWRVPCPACGGYQYLDFGIVEKDDEGNKKLLYGLDFEYDSSYNLRSEVKYKCVHCSISFPFEELYRINQLGKWTRTKESFFNPDNVSLQINSIYSIFSGWDNIAKKFLKAKRDGSPAAFQSFNNLVLGKFFELKKNKITIQDLIDRKSGYCRSEVPEEVGIIFCAIDVQADRLELEFKGWGRDKESFSIEYVKLMGRTDEYKVWGELEDLIFKQRFGSIEPKIYAIDEGDGTRQAIIQDFCRSINRRATAEYIEKNKQKKDIVIHKCMTLKGMGQRQIRNIPLRITEHDKYLKCLKINTYLYKERLMTWLSQEEKTKDGAPVIGYCNFPVDYPKSYYKQLKSEELIVDFDSSGYEHKKWEKKHTRNEALDLCVYNIALVDYFYEKIVLELSDVTGINDWNSMIDYFLKNK